MKTIGGFEVVMGVFVNTQPPEETMTFIKECVHRPDLEKIRKAHQAAYHRSV